MQEGQQKKLKQFRKAFKKYLEKIQSEGVILYIGEEIATPEDIVNLYVEESSIYMPDFVYNEEGTVEEIRYDKVEQQK